MGEPQLQWSYKDKWQHIHIHNLLAGSSRIFSKATSMSDRRPVVSLTDTCLWRLVFKGKQEASFLRHVSHFDSVWSRELICVPWLLSTSSQRGWFNQQCHCSGIVWGGRRRNRDVPAETSDAEQSLCLSSPPDIVTCSPVGLLLHEQMFAIRWDW